MSEPKIIDAESSPEGLDDERTIARYIEAQHEFRIFMEGVRDYLGAHPSLRISGREVVHSYKSRLKDRDHLRQKLARKRAEGHPVTYEQLFNRITDLAGVRIIHLFQDHFAAIDSVIRRKVEIGDWILGETPKAYTWDPEAAQYFSKFDLEIIQKPTAYTSVHYLIRPRSDSILCCEVQVRTLFEEIWGEVDHRINYPEPTDSLACREQILVLSKIVSAGSRLLDSLNRVYNEHHPERN
ncbi:MAG: hypothetical protein RL702_2226 [Pseudomonadota bacterium]|jgi:ppGpp synthetase/RelA/SpoT-type nucleotidyltranferase